MSSSARIATLILLAIHLFAASAPCPTAKLPGRIADHVVFAGEDSHPCPAHQHADDPASAWLDALCPCGCQSGVAPGNGASRTGPALLVAEFVVLDAPRRDTWTDSAARPAGPALAPPDHVPLPIA